MSDGRIKSIRLFKFKGCDDLKLDFDGKDAVIIGDNGTGKSTIFDGFCWALYGKDSRDRSDFDIKTIDRATGEHIHRAEHGVEIVLLVDGSEQTLKRVYLENWVKRRGEEHTTFTGHETQYYFNGVRVDTKQAYDEIVSGFINEGMFKIVTNPLYFNTHIGWQERRTALLAMVGPVDESKLREEFADLIKAMDRDDLATFKKRVAGEKRTNTESLKRIAPEIAGIRRVMPEAEDYEAIEHQIATLKAGADAEIAALRKQVEEIDHRIADRASQDEAIARRHDECLRRQNTERTKLSAILGAARIAAQTKNTSREKAIEAAEAAARKVDAEIASAERTRENKVEDIDAARKKREVIKTEVEAMRADYATRKAAAFDYQTTTTCHACGQELPADTIADAERIARENFEADRRGKLDGMIKSAEAMKITYTKLATLVERYENELSMVDQRLSELKAEKTAADAKVDEARAVKVIDATFVEVNTKATNDEYKAAERAIATIQKELDADITTDNTTLNNERKALNTKIDAITSAFEQSAAPFKERLHNRETVDRCNREIIALEAEEKTLAVKIAELDKAEFAAAAYTKARIATVEEKVNSHFNLVRWKMYDRLVNGNDEECCEAMVDGVPFASLNSAARVLAGVDIIGAFSRFYDVSAPVFIDNAESIVKDINLDAQVIRLQVVKGAKLELQTTI